MAGGRLGRILGVGHLPRESDLTLSQWFVRKVRGIEVEGDILRYGGLLPRYEPCP